MLLNLSSLLLSLQSLHANLANMAETKTWYGAGTEQVQRSAIELAFPSAAERCFFTLRSSLFTSSSVHFL